jgi:hypothetical protein
MGFYAANNIVYMMLLGSIYAIVLSSNILLKEEYDKTAEFLMSRPITRNKWRFRLPEPFQMGKCGGAFTDVRP